MVLGSPRFQRRLSIPLIPRPQRAFLSFSDSLAAPPPFFLPNLVPSGASQALFQSLPLFDPSYPQYLLSARRQSTSSFRRNAVPFPPFYVDPPSLTCSISAPIFPFSQGKKIRFPAFARSRIFSAIQGPSTGESTVF